MFMQVGEFSAISKVREGAVRFGKVVLRDARLDSRQGRAHVTVELTGSDRDKYQSLLDGSSCLRLESFEQKRPRFLTVMNWRPKVGNPYPGPYVRQLTAVDTLEKVQAAQTLIRQLPVTAIVRDRLQDGLEKELSESPFTLWRLKKLSFFMDGLTVSFQDRGRQKHVWTTGAPPKSRWPSLLFYPTYEKAKLDEPR